MQIQLQNTSAIAIVNGIEMRIWEGATESGIPVVALIPRIAVPEGLPAESYAQFDQELMAMQKPTVLSAPFMDSRLEL